MVPAPKMPQAADKNGRMGAMMNTENVPGPGTYIGVESKISGPKFSMYGRDGISKETLEKSRIRSKSEGPSGAGKHKIRRFPFFDFLCLMDVSMLIIITATTPLLPVKACTHQLTWNRLPICVLLKISNLYSNTICVLLSMCAL